MRLDPDMPLAQAALIGCCVTTGVGAALWTAKVQPGTSVVVIGCGGVGLNIIQGAALAGAERIIAVDTLPSKLEYAEVFGATHRVNASEVDPVLAVRDLTRGRGADYAFEAIGLTETSIQALQCTRRGGKAIIVGVIRHGAQLTIDPISYIRTGNCWVYVWFSEHAGWHAAVDRPLPGQEAEAR